MTTYQSQSYFAPTGLAQSCVPVTQGVALGCNISPRCGLSYHRGGDICLLVHSSFVIRHSSFVIP